ncbi:hypothetical protein FRC09_007807 [Ceratobasidium sp. 395]|nr:hypothetical protein FRC09_007807 [Ceratobasidium sp. 395]
MAAVLGPLQNLSIHSAPTFNRPIRPVMSKHFAHPESFPLMLSLGMGTVGCYLGLEGITRRNTLSWQEAQPWSWRNYRLSLTEQSVDEVLFSINV